MRALSHPAGYSLLELLTVVALVGVLASFAVPAFSTTLDRQRVQATLGSLAGDLALARLQAVRSRTPVEIRMTWDPARSCITRYVLRELGPTPRVLKTVRVPELLPRGCLRSNNGLQPIRFGPRGLPSVAIARTVVAQSGRAADTVRLSQLGRVLYVD